MRRSEVCSAFLETPVGRPIRVDIGETHVFGIHWVDKPGESCLRFPRRYQPLLDRIMLQFDEYWSGSRTAFDLPCHLGQASPFVQSVWRALISIPYGETRTYGEVARSLGRSGAARAVGTACARNPFVIVVPCHRVVRHDGSTGNYSAPGGSRLKEALIAFEKSNLRG